MTKSNSVTDKTLSEDTPDKYTKSAAKAGIKGYSVRPEDESGLGGGFRRIRVRRRKGQQQGSIFSKGGVKRLGRKLKSKVYTSGSEKGAIQHMLDKKKAQGKKRDADARIEKTGRDAQRAGMYDSVLPFVGKTLSESGISRDVAAKLNPARLAGRAAGALGRAKSTAGRVAGGIEKGARHIAGIPGRAIKRAGRAIKGAYQGGRGDTGGGYRAEREKALGRQDTSILPFVGMTLSEVYNLLEKRYDDEGNPIPAHKRSFAVGTKMAEREIKDPKTAAANKARREKLKKAGHGSVSAGMAHRSKELRRERSKK